MPSHRLLSRNRPKWPPEARKSDKNTANTQQVRFFKLYFDFNVVSAENRRLFSIEFQLHTNSHITLWLPVSTLYWLRFPNEWLDIIGSLKMRVKERKGCSFYSEKKLKWKKQKRKLAGQVWSGRTGKISTVNAQLPIHGKQ